MLLDVYKESDERPKVALVGEFKGINIARTIIPRYDQWEPSFFQEQQTRQCACHSSVPVLIWMDLCQSMMEPGSFHFNGHLAILVLLVHSQEQIHFRRNMLGRRVRMDRSIGT